MESRGFPEQNWYMSSLCSTAKDLGLRSWEKVVDFVSSFLWMEDIFDAELHCVQDLVTLV
jgi:hypothetical protein